MNKLFEPIQIGSMTLKNRIVMAPMGTTTDTTNAFNMRDVKYYGERAKGGCGLVLTGAVVASTEFEPAPCQKLTNTKDVYMLHLVAERVHFYGAKFGIRERWERSCVVSARFCSIGEKSSCKPCLSPLDDAIVMRR